MVTFVESVRNQLEILKTEEASIRQKIAPLQKELDGLKVQIAHLEAYLATLEPGASPSTRGLEKESITDKIVRVFEREKRPLHYIEILDLLQEHEGFLMPGKDPKANMTAKLAGSSKFSRFDRGVYILSEWAERDKKNAPLN